MVSAFSPVAEMSAGEFRRVTEVTYLGCVYGTISAVSRCERSSCTTGELSLAWLIAILHVWAIDRSRLLSPRSPTCSIISLPHHREIPEHMVSLMRKLRAVAFNLCSVGFETRCFFGSRECHSRWVEKGLNVARMFFQRSLL